MTSRADAITAATVYKDTQAELDAIKGVVSANDAAKKTLGAYMLDKGLDVFSGVTLTCTPIEGGWDSDKLRDFLGERAVEFRKPGGHRKFFGLSRRA